MKALPGQPSATRARGVRGTRVHRTHGRTRRSAARAAKHAQGRAQAEDRLRLPAVATSRARCGPQILHPCMLFLLISSPRHPPSLALVEPVAKAKCYVSHQGTTKAWAKAKCSAKRRLGSRVGVRSYLYSASTILRRLHLRALSPPSHTMSNYRVTMSAHGAKMASDIVLPPLEYRIAVNDATNASVLMNANMLSRQQDLLDLLPYICIYTQHETEVGIPSAMHVRTTMLLSRCCILHQRGGIRVRRLLSIGEAATAT